MKKLTAIVLTFICLFSLASCSVNWTDKEIKNAKSVEITCYDSHNVPKVLGVYTITDEREVNNICNTFSLLVVKNVKITEPTAISYDIRFLDSSGNEIESVSLLFGYNVVKSNGRLYKITDEMDINRYISEDVLADMQD